MSETVAYTTIRAWGKQNPSGGDAMWATVDWLDFPTPGFGYVNVRMEVNFGTGSGWVYWDDESHSIINTESGTAFLMLDTNCPYPPANGKGYEGKLIVTLTWWDDAIQDWVSSATVHHLNFTISP